MTDDNLTMSQIGLKKDREALKVGVSETACCSTAEFERKADYVFEVLRMTAEGIARKGMYNSAELKEIADGIVTRVMP